MVPSEKEIIEECQAGNLGRFGELYDGYIKKIYNFIYYKTHHKQTAEDLTSQTFFKALHNISQCDPNRSFSSWLFKIAQNTVIDYYRTKKQGVNIEDVWDVLSDESDIPRDFDNKAKLDEVKKYMKKLPSIQRDILMMRIWQELSYKEISEVVGKTEENCKVIFSRATRALRLSMPLAVFVMMISIMK